MYLYIYELEIFIFIGPQAHSLGIQTENQAPVYRAYGTIFVMFVFFCLYMSEQRILLFTGGVIFVKKNREECSSL